MTRTYIPFTGSDHDQNGYDHENFYAGTNFSVNNCCHIHFIYDAKLIPVYLIQSDYNKQHVSNFFNFFKSHNFAFIKNGQEN